MQPSHVVLIITDDAEFATDLIRRWRAERGVPRLTVVGSEVMDSPINAACDLAIVGPVDPPLRAALLTQLDRAGKPVVCLVETSEQVVSERQEHSRAIVLQRKEGWVETIVLLSRECLKRIDLSDRLRRAEQVAGSHFQDAALGRYMLDVRHDFNNALTSVLGNAELLLMDASDLSGQARDQLQTIHQMALHMHAVMHRLSSMAMEMRSHSASQVETQELSHAAVAGS